jgi:hypothetical protein
MFALRRIADKPGKALLSIQVIPLRILGDKNWLLEEEEEIHVVTRLS